MTKDESSPDWAVNQEVHDSWFLRHLDNPHHKAKLVHMKGDPSQRGASSGVWVKTSPLQGVVLPETLDQLHKQRLAFTQAVIVKAHEAIDSLAKARFAGDVVRVIQFDSESMSLNYLYGRRRLGADAAGARRRKTKEPKKPTINPLTCRPTPAPL